MMALLAWAWLFALPGLVLTALGRPGKPRAPATPACPGRWCCCWSPSPRCVSGGQADASTIPNWLPFLPDGAFRILADPLSALMLAIVGFVSPLVYVYSLGYMADDPGTPTLLRLPRPVRRHAWPCWCWPATWPCC